MPEQVLNSPHSKWMGSHAVIRSLNRFWTNLCDLDQRSGCLPGHCVLFSLLALTIWAGMLSGLLACRGALSAGLISVNESTPVEARSADGAHKEQHFQVADLVKLWALSRETVRLMVKDDPGVAKIRFGRKKSHTTYKVPESAARRIHADFGGLESAFDEQHYRIGDLAGRWKIGRETVRLMVKDEPGVMKVRMGRKQSHTTYSVPDSVAERIHNRLLCPA
jgi:type IV secretory pathway TrbD component